MDEPCITRRAFLKGLAGAVATGLVGSLLAGCEELLELNPTPGPVDAFKPDGQPSRTEPAATPSPPTEAILPQTPGEFIGEFELPPEGSTAYAICPQPLYASSDTNAFVLVQLPAGAVLRVLEVSEEERWMRVAYDATEGWAQTALIAINLQDVVPSILYDDTDAYASAFRAQGREIPGITGLALYNAKAYNPRFDQEMFIMPVLYHAAKKFCLAQKAALAAGYCLRVYEFFRPMETQLAIARQLEALAAEDPEVQAGISTPPWNSDWFIATWRSNHQMGYAGDISMVRILEQDTASCSGYEYTRLLAFEELPMPTAIHEMSSAAASMQYPINPESADWRNVPAAQTMTEASLLLQTFCADAGLTPLASEWWHFNDNEAVTQENRDHAVGNFVPSQCVSVAPKAKE